MKTHHLHALDFHLGQKPKRAGRKPTLAQALRQARQAGASVKEATIEPNGSIALQFGEPDGADMKINEWDKALRRDTH